MAGMNIVHVITGLGNGGAESVLCRLCEADKANRHHVISLRERGPSADRLERAGVDVHCLDMPRGRIRLQGLIRLHGLLKQLRPDVVQTWMYHADLVGGLIARLSGIRAIVWGIRNSTLDPQRSSRATQLVVKSLAWLSNRVPARILSCSANAAEIHRALGYRADLFVVIPNGYPIAEFIPDADARSTTRASLGISGHMPVLGMAARFDPQKDHVNLLQALVLLKKQGRSFACLLAGDGMVAGNALLSRTIRQYGLESDILLLGQRNDMPNFMNALDVHVLSSCSGEAFPNVLSEAMACGVPCVTTDVGDASLIVGDTGWVVPPSSHQALAAALDAAIVEYSANDDRWPLRKADCRKRIVDNYSLEKMIAAYNEVWRAVVTDVSAAGG